MKARSVLLYGRTNSGKTSQLGVLAEDIYSRTGKTSIVFGSDLGGYEPIMPYIELGIIDYRPMLDIDPWIFIHKSAEGLINEDGKWIKPDLSQVGMAAYETITSFGENMMETLAEKSAKGVNIGGVGSADFSIADSGETLKVGSNNQAHYQVTQKQLRSEIWLSQRLPVDYVVWTAGVDDAKDDISMQKIVGPAAVGHALTGAIPRWFSQSFRIDVIAAKGAIPEKHRLYIGTHNDDTLKTATGLGSSRLPMAAPKLAKTVIEPANIVQALSMIDEASAKAKEIIAKRNPGLG